MDEPYDVVVIGGGAAGLGAALALARSRRTVLLVDAGQPRNLGAAHVHNYLTRDGTAPAELLAQGRAEVVRYGAEVISGSVDVVVREGAGFLVSVLPDRTPRREVRARRLLLATGLVDELPDVPGLAERWGRDVLHCPHCHGWEVRDRRIGILATEPMAAHRAAVWRQWSPHVVLLLHDAPTPEGEEAEWLAALGVAVVQGPAGGLVLAGDVLAGVRLASGDVVALDALVVAPRYRARAELLAPLGLEPVDAQVGGIVVGSQVPAGATGATALPGVWAAGNAADVRDHVVMAAAAGLNAGVAINADLVAEDTRRAVDAYRRRPAVDH